MPIKTQRGPCNPACASVLKFMTKQTIPAQTGMNVGTWQRVDGHRFMNVFVDFEQSGPNEDPVDLTMSFAFDAAGALSAGHTVTFEENLASPQTVNFNLVSGAGTWHGSPHNRSSYIARSPVLGPYALAFAYNLHTAPRKVSVWAYLVS
jgi:hypothetical protein